MTEIEQLHKQIDALADRIRDLEAVINSIRPSTYIEVTNAFQRVATQVEINREG